MSRFLRYLLISMFLAAVTFMVYWRALDNGFIVYYDDGEYVTQNTHIQGGLTPDAISWAFTSMHSANWHPVTWMSHMLDFALYGLNPAGHHLTNLLLHTASTILLFLLLTRMTGLMWRSAFVAALFAVHPLHVESVAWIAERKDVLSAFFWMLTMWAYVRYSERPGLARYSLVVLAFGLGLMCKPMLVTLPLVLLLLDYWPLGRLTFGGSKAGDSPSSWRLVREKMPFFAMSAASSVITYVAQQKSGAIGEIEAFSVEARVMNAAVSYVSYIGKMLWPSRLSAIYPHPGDALPIWRAVTAAVILAAICVLVIRAGRRHPYLPVGWFWYVLTLIPVIGLVQVGGQAMADRYTYVPLIGLFIMIAWGVPGLLRVGEWEKGRSQSPTNHSPANTEHPTPNTYARCLVVISAVVVVVLACRTWVQVQYWRDSTTLLEHAIEVTSDNYGAHDALGAALAAEGRYEEAIAQHEAALKITPTYEVAHNNLGAALARAGRIDQAIVEYRAAIRIYPRYAEAHYNLAKALAMQGDRDAAVTEYGESLRLDPDNAEAHNNLGNLFQRKGKLDDAVREYQAALRIDPSFAQARANLAGALAQQGKTAESIRESRLATSANPESAAAHYNLGVALQNQGKTDDAIKEYRDAIRIRPNLAQAHNNLALALFDKGEYTEAWKEVHLCRKHGVSPHPDFIKALAEKMPDPSP
jgi:tetratricopeptide (TPR) repeat protein